MNNSMISSDIRFTFDGVKQMNYLNLSTGQISSDRQNDCTYLTIVKYYLDKEIFALNVLNTDAGIDVYIPFLIPMFWNNFLTEIKEISLKDEADNISLISAKYEMNICYDFGIDDPDRSLMFWYGPKKYCDLVSTSIKFPREIIFRFVEFISNPENYYV